MDSPTGGGYRPLADVPSIAFHLHHTSLYNSVFRYDDEMLINTHLYGEYGYLAPILHLRQVEGADLFAMYVRSFERVWGLSYPVSAEELDRKKMPCPRGPICGSRALRSARRQGGRRG